MRSAIVLVAAAAVLALAACSPEVDRRVVGGALDELSEHPFYVLPDPIPAGEPGTVVRTERLHSAPDGAIGWRVLYHSQDVHGTDILVSGIVISPTGDAPAGGRPVMSWGHPTTGAAERCAPSLGIDPDDWVEGLYDFLNKGYVVTATDYSGMGAAGPDSYLIGMTEGRNVLDIARAAQSIPETKANDDVLLWGHSQGGQAVLFAAGEASAYAPELTVRGVGVAAPATELGGLLSADIGDVSGVTIGSYAFTAFSEVYASTPGSDLGTILTPAAVEAVPKINELCLLGQNKELHEIATPLIGGFLSGDPTKVEPWATMLAENSVDPSTIDVPMFVAQGEIDELVKPEVTQGFVDSARKAGVTVEFEQIPKTGHGLVALRALDGLFAWIERLPNP